MASSTTSFEFVVLGSERVRPEPAYHDRTASCTDTNICRIILLNVTFISPKLLLFVFTAAIVQVLGWTELCFPTK